MLHWFQKEKNTKKNYIVREAFTSNKASSKRALHGRFLGFESLENRQLLSAGPWGFFGFGFGFGFGGGGHGSAYTSSQSGGSTSTTPASPVVTSITLAASSAVTQYGQNVTLTATVAANSSTTTTTSGTPTGLVQFLDGTTVIGTANLHNGVATLQVGDLAASATGDAHTLTAEYMGNSSYSPSSVPAASAVTVTVTQAGTITLLTSVGNYATASGSITLSAEVSPNYATSSSSSSSSSASPMIVLPGGFYGRGGWGGQATAGLPPTGTVTFEAFDATGASLGNIGTAELQNNGHAEISVLSSSLPTGAATIAAVYSGDTNYLGSNSQAISDSYGSTAAARLVVKPSNPVTVNTADTLSITVKPGKLNTSTAAPTGTVTLYDATTKTSLTGTAPISLTASTSTTGTAAGTFSATFTTPGLHLVVAVYSGDSNYAAEEVIIPVFVQETSASNGGGSGGGGGNYGFGGRSFGGWGFGGLGSLFRGL